MKDSLLEPRCVCARCDVLTHKKKRNSARSRSDNVEVSESGHVVIGDRIVQCHHAHSWPFLNCPLLWGTERSGVNVTNWQGFWWEGGMRSYVQISCPVVILDRMFLREFLKDGRVLRPSLRKLA